MNKRLVHVAPLQCGTVLAALYFCVSLVFVPFFLLMAMIPHVPSNQSSFSNHAPFPFGLVFVVAVPFFYAFVGFIGGIVAAAAYNLIAKITGGIQFRVVDVPPGTREALDPMLD